MLALIAALLFADPAEGAKVSIIQGTIEAKGPTDADFAPLKAGGQLQEGTWIRSAAGAKALLELPNSVELRVNQQTEVLFESPLKLSLKLGEIFVRIPRGAAKYGITTPDHPIQIEECVMDLDYKPRIPNGAPSTTTIMVLEGKARAFTKKFSPEITAGFYTVAYGAQLNTPDPMRNGSMDTAWVHSLLVERGKVDEEVTGRTDELLSILSKIQPNDPAEVALRSLGELAAEGTARWLGRSFLETQVARRAAAAHALADAATIKSAGLLSGLLQHNEAQVRVIVAGGLGRLAGGKDLGFKEEYWKGENQDAGRKAWEEWVQKNSK